MTRLKRDQLKKLGIIPEPETPKPKERDIQKAVKDYLNLTGWFCFKIHQSLGSYRGIADLYAIKNGVSVWIEVKTPNGKLSAHQNRFREEIEKRGGIYIVVRSLDEAQAKLEALGGNL